MYYKILLVFRELDIRNTWTCWIYVGHLGHGFCVLWCNCGYVYIGDIGDIGDGVSRFTLRSFINILRYTRVL